LNCSVWGVARKGYTAVASDEWREKEPGSRPGRDKIPPGHYKRAGEEPQQRQETAARDRRPKVEPRENQNPHPETVRRGIRLSGIFADICCCAN